MQRAEGRFKNPRTAIITYLVLAMLSIWTIGPIYWVVVTSFKHDKEIYGAAATLLPREFTLKNYIAILFERPFPNFFFNSIRVAAVTTFSSIFLGILGAYAFIYLRFPGQSVLARGMITTYLIPPVLLAFPLFTVLRRIGLIDSVYGLMLAHLTFTVPFCTWMLMSYLKTVPRSLHEAALVDGCTRIGIQALAQLLEQLALFFG